MWGSHAAGLTSYQHCSPEEALGSCSTAARISAFATLRGSGRVTRSHPLFVLAMEVLNALFRLVNTRGVLSSLQAPAIRFWLSVYADDLIIFLMTTTHETFAVSKPFWKHLRKYQGCAPTFSKVS
jgi:hypothetical protein